jgi:hypothetical protein
VLSTTGIGEAKMAKRAIRVLLTLAMALVFGHVTNVQAAEPAENGEIEVQLWPGAEPGQTIAIITLELPDAAELPATVRLPVLAGMKVDWAGEIAGQGGEDVQREPQLGSGSGGQYAEFELSQYRLAQIELSGLPITMSGGTFSTSVDYVQTVPSETTGFSVRVPANVSDVTIDPAPTGDPARNSAGEALYTLPARELETGAAQKLSISYSVGSSQGSRQGGEALSRSTILAILLGLIAVAVAALVFVLSRQRSA